MKKTDLVVVDHKEFGLEETVAKDVKAFFTPMLEKMDELEGEFNEVIKLNPDTPEAAGMAKQLRLKYVKVRTGTAQIHQEQKAFYLKAGRFIDGFKNAQAFASEGKESKLKAIEDHAAIKAQKIIDDLQEERAALLTPFWDSATPIPADLGKMSPDFWKAFLKGAEATERERVEAEKAAEKEAARIRKENELHEERKEKLLDYWTFMSDEQKVMEYGKMSKPVYQKMLVSLIKLKEAEQKRVDEAQEKVAEIEARETKKQERITGLVYGGSRFDGVKFYFVDSSDISIDEVTNLSDEAFSHLAKVKQEEVDRVDAEAEKTLEEMVAQLVEIGFEEQEGGVIKGHGFTLTRERLKEFTPETFNTRLDEIVELIESRKAVVTTPDPIRFEIPSSSELTDEKRFEMLVDDLNEIASQYAFDDPKNQKTYDSVGKLISKVITYINDKK